MRPTSDLLKSISEVLQREKAAGGQLRNPKPEVLLSWFQDRKAIRDPVYDQIILNELERAVLRTAEFQRLRYVKQMDFAYLVYPAAEHSRFTHSLGVCQAAKDLFDQVRDNFEKKEILRSDFTADQHFERPHVQDFCLFDRVLVSLAALLHDLGHPPFSHAFDMRDDLLGHDDFETNPFMLRALFDTSSSDLARTLEKWDPYFKVLMRAEAPQLFPESEAVEGTAIQAPCLAALVLEILAVKDDLGETFRCLCPGITEMTIECATLEAHARNRWIDKGMQFSLFNVKSSAVFRRVHCDIVANTISADLLDYIRRDTRVAGLPRDLDRRFFSYISCARYRQKSRVVVELEDRQGHVRRDVLSDLMNCMETRYIIHERIVLHRSVVASRAMAARLYGPCNSTPPDPWSVVEQMYGPWGQWLSDGQLLAGTVDRRDFNIDMAKLLRLRSLYRPIVILDSERSKRHNVTVPEDARQRLAKKFGAQADKATQSASDKGILWSTLMHLEQTINEELLGDLDQSTRQALNEVLGSAPPTMSVCMKPSVLFKNPRIMVRIPTALRSDQGAATSTRIQVLDDWLSQVIALNTYESDEGTCAQIHALNVRYAELWRLYIFAHPILFAREIFRPLLADFKARWEKEIVKEAALPGMPPNVSRDDLRPVDVLDRLDDQPLIEAISLARQSSPGLPLTEAIRILRQPGVDLHATVKELRARTQIDPMVGLAAKGGTTRLSETESVERFKEYVITSKDIQLPTEAQPPGHDLLESEKTKSKIVPSGRRAKKSIDKGGVAEKSNSHVDQQNDVEGDTDDFTLGPN